MINIGFLVLRETFLKTMGCLIQETLKAGHIVTLLYDEKSATGAKAYQRITRQKLSSFERLGAQVFSVDSGNLEKFSKFGIDVLVVMEGFHFFQNRLGQLDELRNTGTKIVSLAHFFESLSYPLEALESFDKTYYLSSFAVDTHFSLYRENPAEITKSRQASRFEISGSPMFDQLIDLDEDEIRKEMGIPATKKVVVLLAPVINKTTEWRFYIWKQKSRLKRFIWVITQRKFEYIFDAFFAPTFTDIGKSIRDFCDRNDAFLIIKSRLKQDDEGVFGGIADLYLSGEHETYFPIFTSYKILSTANLCITAMSMAALEAVACSVPVVNIFIPSTEYVSAVSEFQPDRTEYLDAITNIKKESPFSYVNCVTSVGQGKFARWIRSKSMGEFSIDEKARRSYVNRFLGFSEESSSARILRSLEHLCHT